MQQKTEKMIKGRILAMSPQELIDFMDELFVDKEDLVCPFHKKDYKHGCRVCALFEKLTI